MMRKNALVLFSVLAASALFANDEVDAKYSAVRDEVLKFRADDQARKFRHNYDRLIGKLRGIVIENPNSDRADDALYITAQLYDELYQVSLVGRDLEAGIQAYEEMSARYPTSNLADDALFRAARLRLEKLGDRDGARRDLALIVEMKGADFRPQAKELLSRLPPVDVGVESSSSSDDGTSRDVNAILKKVEREINADGVIRDGDASSSAAGDEGDVAGGSSDGPTREVLALSGGPSNVARKLNSVQHHADKKTSTVRVRLSDAVEVRQGEIAADETHPRRVFFELTPVKLGRQALKPIDVNDGSFKRVRVGQFDEDTVRVVMEIEGKQHIDVDTKKRPFELSFSIAKPEAKSEAKIDPKIAQKPPAPASMTVVKTEPAPATKETVRQRVGESGAPGGVSLSQQMGLKVRRVVIDAGHGGHDTGAIGPTGIREKEVTLAISKKIKKRLEEKIPGIEVILTRDDDKFVELADRTAIANAAGADLFISVHANANPSRKVRGIETYYLNITSDRYAIRLAQRENSETEGASSINDLEFILADLAMKSNVDDSIRLGRHVQGSLVGRLRKDYSDVQDLGLKHALFFVLLGSRMPAILVETSFVSNRVEEKRLGSTDYQDAIADGVVKGVQRFMEERQAFASVP